MHGVEVGDYVLVGMGAILLGGSKIGEGAIVGAGAVVLENMEIPPYAVAGGSPARVVEQLAPAKRTAVAIEHSVGYVEQALRHVEGEWDGLVSA